MTQTTAGVTLALTLVLAACGGGAPDGAAMSSGEALYAANCASCHGDRLLGDGPMAASLPIEPPSLIEHLGHHPMDQLVQLIQSGVPPAMPPAPLTDEDVREVIDYAWTLVPDSLVEGLREMQRQAEMGMPMDMGGMGMDGDSSGGMSGMDHSEHMMSPDTTGR